MFFFFENDKFTSRVSQKRAIWDLRCEEYANKTQKLKQWTEVVQEMCGVAEMDDE